MKPLFCLIMLLGLSLSTQLTAQVPNKISYQGLLTTSSGAPVPDGSYDLTFKIFNVSTEGSALWTENHNGVAVQHGTFNVFLGSVTPFNISFNQTLFVEITAVSGPGISSPITFTPRSELLSSPYAFSVIGIQCSAPGAFANAAGTENISEGNYATIGGGWANHVSGVISTIAGGERNVASGNWATIGGGYRNKASGNFNSTVSGGYYNTAAGSYATVGGGRYNNARGDYSVVGGGGGLEADSNSAMADYSVISGGKGNYSNGMGSVIAGGYSNSASGNRAVVGGGEKNSALGDNSVVCGGYYNSASNSYVTVSGGYFNSANSYGAFIGGGTNNSATGMRATVAGGWENNANAERATIGGGYLNTASGLNSTIPGGRENVTSGSYSFAAGRQAKANHDGAFVWADNTTVDFASTGTNQFLIRASGGLGLNTNSPEGMFDMRPGTSLGLVIQSSTGINSDDIVIKRPGTLSGSNVRFSLSERSTNNALWLYGYDGSSYKNFISFDYATNKIMCPANTGMALTIDNNYSRVGIGISSPSVTLDVGGSVLVRDLPTGSGTTIVQLGSGILGRLSSSLRYKTNVVDLSSDSKVLNLRPVKFQWKDSGKEDIGLIAEEVDEVLKDLVIYDEEGKPDAVKYDRISIYLISIVKEQQKRIEELEKQIKSIGKNLEQ